MSEDTTENRGPVAVDLSADMERDRTFGGRVPRGTYKLRIVEEPDFSTSKEKIDPKTHQKKGGNPMLVFQLEITEPTEVVVDGDTYTTGGVKLRTWATFIIDNKTGLERNPTLADIHKASEGKLPARFLRDMDTGLPINDEGIPIAYTGTEFWAIVDSKEVDQRGDDGKVLVNPLTQEELRGWQYSLGRIFVPQSN